VSGIVVSELEYGPPGADQLFFDVSFRVAPGEHAAIVGANGVGKSTILRILTGQLEADAGEFSINGSMLYMTQFHTRRISLYVSNANEPYPRGRPSLVTRSTNKVCFTASSAPTPLRSLARSVASGISDMITWQLRIGSVSPQHRATIWAEICTRSSN